MYTKRTATIAKWLASSLVEANHVVVPVSNQYPLAVIVEQLAVAIPGQRVPLGYDTEEFLSEYAQLTNEQIHDGGPTPELERLSELMEMGVRKMLSTARNIINPICREVVEKLENISPVSETVPVEIKPFVFSSVFSEPGLTQHLATYRDRFSIKPTYRTFSLRTPNLDDLIEYIAATPLVDSDTIREWALGLDGETLRGVWYDLFSRHEFHVADMGFLGSGRFPTNLDQLLVAYFLTGYLRDNPEAPDGENVTLQEWEKALGQLHGLMGLKLLEYHDQRERAKRNGRFILEHRGFRTSQDQVVSSEATMTVFVNPDLVDTWSEKGGDPRVILGAVSTAPTVTNIDPLLARAQEFINEWDLQYRRLKNERRSQNEQNSVHLIANVVEDCASGYDLTSKTGKELIEELVRLGERDSAQIYKTVLELVCRSYFPDTAREYLSFFESMEKYGCDLNAREAATMATVEMVASWLHGQMTKYAFEPDIKEDAQRDALPIYQARLGAKKEEVKAEEPPAQEPSEEVGADETAVSA